METLSSSYVFNAIKTSVSRKYPGPDGITKIFYIRTFHLIGREVTFVINEALQGNVPVSFVDGVIVLVRKRGGTCRLSSLRTVSLFLIALTEDFYGQRLFLWGLILHWLNF